MKNVLEGLRGVLIGILTALVSSGIVAGSLVLSFTEGGQPSSLPLAPSVPTSYTLTLPPPPVILPTSGATTILTSQVSNTATVTLTLPPPPTGCPPPPGWSALTLYPGDTLNRLAEAHGTTPEALIQANCLAVSRLAPGSLLYVPGSPPQQPPEACGPPYGWVFYTIRPGDTLFSLGLRLGVSVSELQFANCLGDSTTIRAGQRLYVPFLPPLIPARTETPTLAPTPSQTGSPQPPTSTPINTPTPVPSPTPTAEPTSTETLPPSNRPPSLSRIPAQQTNEDVPAGPILFTVRDAETPADQLIVSATSSNPALIPEGDIWIGGSGAQRAVRLAPGENQSGSASITISVQDADGAVASETFNLAVAPVNDAPVANNDLATIPPETTLLLDVLANDMDVDGDRLSISIQAAPQHGTVYVDGILVVYIPDPGFSGADAFSYSISDGNGGSDTAQVNVTVE